MQFFDGHLDLAMNALLYKRDQTWPVERVRKFEAEVQGQDDRGLCTTTLDELGRAEARWCTVTLFSRARPGATARQCFLRSDADAATPTIAAARAQAQLAYYRLLERQGHLRIATPGTALRESPANDALEVLILMEGCDPVPGPDDLPPWRDLGVRTLSLTHTEPNTYAMGNHGDGPLTGAGRDLLKVMDQLHMPLDLSHLCEKSFFDALEAFRGRVLVSHANARALCPGRRQLSDDMIRAVVQRDAVIAIMLYNACLVPGWKTGVTPREGVTFAHVADHIDHICRLAGDTGHVAIGSDLDGGFGAEATPHGLDTMADIYKLAKVLAERGYGPADLAGVFHENWLRFWA